MKDLECRVHCNFKNSLGRRTMSIAKQKKYTNKQKGDLKIK